MRLLTFLLLAGCTAEAPPSASVDAPRADPLSPDSLAGTFDGYYSAGFEHTGFRPCADTTEAWWTEPATITTPTGRDEATVSMEPAADIYTRYQEIVGDDPGVYGEGVAVWARFRGRATPRGDGRRMGGYGHMNAYSRAFDVDSVEAMRASAPPSACPQPSHIRP